MKELLSTTDVRSYFELSSLNAEMNISENGQLKFHWANWSKTCLIQKQMILGNDAKLFSIDENIDLLKNYPIWYQRKLKTVKSSLYDLYQSYMDPRLKLTWQEHQNETLVSLHHQSGPFVPLTSMRWMNKETYNLFILKKLLTGYYPMREFRISSDIEFTGELNSSPLDNAKIKITQFSSKGMIIAVNGHSFDKVKNCQNIEFKINLREFLNLQNIGKFKYKSGADDETLSIKGHSFREHGNLYNAAFSNSIEYYFFIPYSEIEVIGYEKSAIQIFGNFVKSIEMNFEDAINSTSLEYEKNKRRAA